jgi:hypothetical protein
MRYDFFSLQEIRKKRTRLLQWIAFRATVFPQLKSVHTVRMQWRSQGVRGVLEPPLCQKFFYSINKLVVCFAPPAPRSQISDNEPPPHFQTLATPLYACKFFCAPQVNHSSRDVSRRGVKAAYERIAACVKPGNYNYTEN